MQNSMVLLNFSMFWPKIHFLGKTWSKFEEMVSLIWYSEPRLTQYADFNGDVYYFLSGELEVTTIIWYLILYFFDYYCQSLISGRKTGH